MAAKRLKRSVNDRMLFGVAGGLAEYFDIDPVIVRVGFVLLTFANLLGLIGYVILAIVTPKAETGPSTVADVARQNLSDLPREAADAGRRASEQLRTPGASNGSRVLLILGAILIVIGGWFLLSNLGIRSILLIVVWPLLIILAGGLLLLVALRQRSGGGPKSAP